MIMFIQYGIPTKDKIGVNMKVYTGVFIKKNGDARTMRFVRMEDLPKSFLETKVKNKRRASVLSEGKELVWDLDKDNFRVFDWKTSGGVPPVVTEAPDEILMKSLDKR